MHHATVVVFSTHEAATFRAAARFVPVAFPFDTDPLANFGLDPAAPRETFPDDDPRRRAVTALTQPFDTHPYQRLLLARETLTATRDRLRFEADPAYWVASPVVAARGRWEAAQRQDADASFGDADGATRMMAQSFAAERANQARLVEEALDLLDEALAPMGPADDTTRLRQEKDSA